MLDEWVVGSALSLMDLQRILITTTEPEIALLGHVLSQIQGSKVQPIIAGL